MSCSYLDCIQKKSDTVWSEILAVIKFGGFVPKMFITLSVDLNLVVCSMVQYRHTYMHTEKKFADFNLVVKRHTTKPPNFLAIR